MKKFVLTIAAAALAASSALAEGYQVNTLSARQEGMGHTGVALKLGSESMFFNPAGLSFMNKTMQVSGSFTAISSHVNADINGNRYSTDNKVSTPISFAAGFRIFDNLYAGLSFYTPYGSSINWTKNWPGAVLTQSVDLKVYTLQPTFSWRLTKNLSIGAGITIGWGSVNLTKGLVDAGALDKLLSLQNTLQGTQLPPFRHVSPASANLVGNSEIAVGFNIGAMYDINSQWTVGADFRSKLNMHVKAGDVTVEYANQVAEAVLSKSLNNLNSTNFDASMPCPWVLTAGVSYKPIEKLTLAFDAQLNGWGTYKQLDIAFAEQSQFDQHLVKDYHNAMTWHLGAEYRLTKRFDVRAGMMIDQSPCNKDYYNPETPGTTRIEPSVGLSFRPVKGLSIDVAFMYVAGMKVKNARGVYDNFLAPTYNGILNTPVAPGVTVQQYMGAQGVVLQPMEKESYIYGDYKLHAFIPSIGISYSF